MKTFSTFYFSFLLFIYCANGQSWAPTGAKWTYGVSWAFSAEIDTVTIQSTGDSIILGKQCKALQKSTQLCDFRPTTEFMYEDSGKVFYYDDSLNSFQILYNFNNTVGDTTTMFRTIHPVVDSIIYIVDSVTTIVINGVSLKELVVHYLHFNMDGFYPNGSGRIIDGIGDTRYMFAWAYAACDANFGGPLRCYQDTIIGFYDFHTAPSCGYIYTGINELNHYLNTLIITPNPFTTSTTLQFNAPLTNAEVIIYDVLGNGILSKTISGNSMEIEKGRLANGIYFVKVNADDSGVEKQWVGKLAVE